MRYVFILGYKQRCGINYGRSLTLAARPGGGSWRNEPAIGDYLKAVRTAATAFARRDPALRDSLVANAIRDLRQRIDQFATERNLEYVMLIRPSLKGLSDLIECFTETAGFLLIIRDPLDVVNSFVKAIELRRRGLRGVLLRWAARTRLLHWKVARETRAAILDMLPDLERYRSHNAVRVVRYEDLVAGQSEALDAVARVVGVPEFPQSQFGDVAVRGSSFNREELGVKNRWQNTAPGEQFQPVGRWKRAGVLARWFTSLGLRGVHRRLGYF